MHHLDFITRKTSGKVSHWLRQSPKEGLFVKYFSNRFRATVTTVIPAFMNFSESTDQHRRTALPRESVFSRLSQFRSAVSRTGQPYNPSTSFIVYRPAGRFARNFAAKRAPRT